MPERLTQAISRTSPTIAISSPRNPAKTSMWPGIIADAVAVSPFPRFSFGNSRSSPAPIATSSAFACATVTPGLSRPPMISHTASREVSIDALRLGEASAIAEIGTHASLRITVVPWKPSGAMPTTENALPLSATVWPTTLALPPNRRCHSS